MVFKLFPSLCSEAHIERVLNFGHPSLHKTFAQLNSFLLFAASGAPPKMNPSHPIGSQAAQREQKWNKLLATHTALEKREEVLVTPNPLQSSLQM